jgi:hypothetical protein
MNSCFEDRDVFVNASYRNNKNEFIFSKLFYGMNLSGFWKMSDTASTKKRPDERLVHQRDIDANLR